MPSGATDSLLDHAGYVYGAAVAACADPELADAIAERVMTSAIRIGCANGLDRARLVEDAVLLAVRTDPSSPFSQLPAEEREVIALARLCGYTAQEIALVVDTSVEQVKATMLSGLARLADARAHATVG